MTITRELSQIRDYETLTDFLIFKAQSCIRSKVQHKVYHKTLYNNVLKYLWIDERYTSGRGLEKVFINKENGKKATKAQLQKAVKMALADTEKELGL